MIGILIVDDEKNIRAGIHKILRENLADPVRFIEAKNGEEALEFIASEKPDLVVTDIRMPRMDGVALMREISKMTDGPMIIVLSGYDDFSFAREAIANGAVSYILKPIDRNELVAAVSRAVGTVSARKKTSAEKSLRQVIAEGRLSRESFSARSGPSGPFRVCVVAARGSGLSDEPSLAGADAYCIEKRADRAYFLVAEREIENAVVAFPSGDLRMGVSGPCRTLANLRSASRQAEIAAFSFFLEASSPVFRYRQNGAPFDRNALNARAKKIGELLGNAEGDAVEAAVIDAFNLDMASFDDRLRYLFYLHDFFRGDLVGKYWEVGETDMYLTLKGLMIENVFAFRSIGEYRSAALDYALYLNALLSGQRSDYSFVSDATEYIRLHFREDVNMTVVANRVSANYTYFSEKFKEQNGVNFNDYLKRLRIDEAKRLLEKGVLHVYEVAAQCGFRDVKYFTRTFKEVTGLSPAEYRKRF